MAVPKATKIPSLIYGTAWKKDQTRDLVRQALLSGFRGIDTAAQPKHYEEDLVGQGLRDAMQEGGIKRQDLYIQTKFTSLHGQDPKKLPYDPSSSITDQVNASVKSSLHNLYHAGNAQSKPYIDCLVLHSPFPSPKQTQEAWRAMESHAPHSVRTNRFYADTGYDVGIRAFCAEKNITYQSFWTLTANPYLMRSKPVAHVAVAAGIGKPVALYALVLGLGKVSVLDGTTNAEHMKADLKGVQRVEVWAVEQPGQWTQVQQRFAELVNG